jgi:hypothetical protein
MHLSYWCDSPYHNVSDEESLEPRSMFFIRTTEKTCFKLGARSDYCALSDLSGIVVSRPYFASRTHGVIAPAFEHNALLENLFLVEDHGTGPRIGMPFWAQALPTQGSRLPTRAIILMAPLLYHCATQCTSLIFPCIYAELSTK